jgi:hypothetical protein
VDVDTVLYEIGITHLESYFAQVMHGEAPFAIRRGTSSDDEGRTFHRLRLRTQEARMAEFLILSVIADTVSNSWVVGSIPTAPTNPTD